MILCFHQMIPRLTSLDIVISSAVSSILMILHISRQLKKLAANCLKKWVAAIIPEEFSKFPMILWIIRAMLNTVWLPSKFTKLLESLRKKALKNSAYTHFFAQIRLLMSITLCLQSFFLNLLPILKLSLVYILPLSTSQAVSEFLINPIKSLMTFSLLVRA